MKIQGKGAIFSRRHITSQAIQMSKVGLAGLYSIYLYSIVGPEVYGVYNLIAAFAAYTFLLDGSYLVQVFQVDYRNHPSARIFTTALAMITTCSVLTIPIVVFLSVSFTDVSKLYCLLYALGFGMYPLQRFFNGVLVVTERIELLQSVPLATRIVCFPIVYVLAHWFNIAKIEVLLYAFLGESLLLSLVLGSAVIRKSGIDKVDGDYAKKLLRNIVPLAGGSIVTGVIYHSVKVVLGKNLSVADFGRLSLLTSLIEGFKGPGNLYVTYRYPHLIDGQVKLGFFKNSVNEFKGLFKFSGLGIVVALILCVITELMLPFQIMERFRELKFFMFFIFFYSVLRPFAGMGIQLVNATKMTKVIGLTMPFSALIQLLIAKFSTIFGLWGAFIGVCVNGVLSGTISYVSLAAFLKLRTFHLLNQSKQVP